MSKLLRIAGMMSGTSMDSLDCCICDIQIKKNMIFDFKIIDKISFPFSIDIIDKIRSYVYEINNDYQKLDNYLGKFFFDLSKNFISNYEVDCISIHGQTIVHIDKVKSLQLVNPKYLFDYFGVPIVHNFRQKDIINGGNGAPLMPYLDWLIFKKYKMNYLTINLGGIANISFINENGSRDNILGFDIGPGMCLIDEYTNLKWNKLIDKDAKLSSSGKINKELLNLLMQNDFINKPPPKSTGRTDFGLNFVQNIEKYFSNLSPHDILRTIVNFTSKAIKLNIEKYILKSQQIDRIVISGGGINHPILINDMKKDLDFKFEDILDYGVHSKFKECLLMAVLGYSKINKIHSNIPNVTGSSKNIILGEIYENK